MDFFERQPHPENDEVACTRYAPDARPLTPAVEEDAVLCACAYLEGGYQLLVVPAAAPDTVKWYTGRAAHGTFRERGPAIRCAKPIRSVSWLLRPGSPLLCIHGEQVYFYSTGGEPVQSIPLGTRWATAYWGDHLPYLVTEDHVYPLTEGLACTGQAFPVRARPCLGPDNRTDVLWQTGRTNPGTMGGMLFRHNGAVHYVCGDTFDRCATENRDTFLCDVRRLEDPYSRRYLAIPNGGAACLFAGEGNRVYAAFVGQTGHSTVQGKAAILPMDFIEGQFFRPGNRYYLETPPSARLRPVGGIDGLRDSFIYAAPDGWYYLTGTTPGPAGSYLADTSAIRLWRSRDLESFAPLGVVYDFSDTPASWQNNISRERNSWAPEMIYHSGTYWITYSTSPGCGLLKSESGRPEGPYRDMGRVVHRGIDSGFFQEDGVLYLIWQNGRIAPLSEDGLEMLAEPVLLLPRDGREVGYEGAGLIRVNGKYVLYAAEWNGDFRIDGSYDMMYSVSDHLLGPYTPRRLLIAHGGHSCLFFDHHGGLRYTIFGNDRTAPFRRRLGIGRLEAEGAGDSFALRAIPE